MGINRGTVLDLINDVHRAGGFKDYNSYSYLFNQVDTMPESKEDAEPHWIPVTEDTPDEERECWITPKTTSKVYRGVFTRHYGECHRTGFICDDGFMWLNTALAWMYCELPEPYKGVTE